MHLTLTSPVQSSGRFFTRSNVRGYCFGFNGQMKDDEVYGEGNSYTAEYWQYDPRLGRRWNVDPLASKYPFASPYSAFQNNPLIYVDNGGDSTSYYMNGVLIHVSHDGLENAVVVIQTEDVVFQRIVMEQIKIHKENGTANSDVANTNARQFFVDTGHFVYMIDEYKKLYNKSSKIMRADNPKYSDEAGFKNYQKNGEIRPGPFTKEGNEPGWTFNYGVYDPELGEEVSKGHTHENSGLPRSPIGTYTQPPSEYDLDPMYKAYDVTISEDYIYIHNTGEKGKSLNLAIPKNGTFGGKNSSNPIQDVNKAAANAFKQ